jgi:PAS domain S-box-containing protein
LHASAKFSKFAPVVAGLLAALLIPAIEGIGSPPANLMLSNVLQSAVVFWAAYCSFRAARISQGYLRQLWFLLVAALLMSGVARLAVAYHPGSAHPAGAVQWVSDVVFILWVTPAVMMFLPPSAKEISEIDWQRILDLVQVAVVALTAYLCFIYVPYLSEDHGPQTMHRMLQAQLIRDVALGASLLLLGVRAYRQFIRAFFRGMFYFFLAAIASDFIYLLGSRTFSSVPNWTDIAWCAPYLYLVFFAASWKAGKEDAVQETLSPVRVTIFSRIFPAAIPLLVLFMGMRVAPEQMRLAWVAIAASFVLSAARFTLTNEKQSRRVEDSPQTDQGRPRSESLFSAAFRLSPDAMAINAVPGAQFLEVNDAFTRLTGYAREEIVGRTALEMNLWVDPEHRAKVMAKLQETSEVREEEFLCRTKTGGTRIFQFSGRIIEQDGRRLSLTLARDITARKKAEEVLRANEERFRSLIEELHVGILLLGPDAEATFANQAALDMFGLRREQALGNRISQIYFDPIQEDGTKIPSSMLPGARSIESGQTIRNQVVGWRRPVSNDILWTLIGAIPQLTEQGKVASVILSITNISELKRAEEALRASEELFRTLVENMHAAVVLLGPDQEIQFANQASFKMFGMKEEQVLGKKVFDLGPSPLCEDGTEMPFSMRPVSRAIATRQAVLDWVMGYRLPASNEVLWLQGEAVPILGENGLVEKVITSFSDITERKKAQEALRASEQRFRTLVENLHVGIILLGPDQEIQFANRASLKFFGMKQEHILGKRTTDLGMTPLNEDGTEMPDSMRPTPRAIAARQAVLSEVFGWRHPGSNDVLWLQGDAVPLFRENGELDMVILSHSDITERKKAEEALRKSEELFRTLVENLHAGVVLLGPNQESQYANRASSKMFKLKEKESLGKSTIDLGFIPLNEDGAEIPPSMRPVARAIATKQAVLDWVMGWRLPGADDILWIHGEAMPLLDKNGEVERLIATYSDITQWKQAEEALHQLSKRLLQLQDEERRRIGRELHDVLAQSVMAVNLDLAQVARSSVPLDKKARQALSAARSMLGEMSREIRTLSYTLHPPVLDELGLALAIQEYATGFSERSGIALKVDIQADFGRLTQEAETALFRIVQECLSNIQRHSGSKAATIRLSGFTDRIELLVSDQGRGMSQIKVDRRGNAGTSLGVGILGMRERMVQLGGRLEVESGSLGTTVRATIPVKVEVSRAVPDSSG